MELHPGCQPMGLLSFLGGAESQLDDVGGALSEQLSAAGRDLCKKLPVLSKKL